MAGLTKDDRECMEILSMEISGMLIACNHILKVTSKLAEQLADTTKRLHDISFYNHLQQKNNDKPIIEGVQ